MRLSEWVKEVRGARRSAGFSHNFDGKVIKSAGGLRWRIAERKKCDMGHEHSRDLLIEFKEARDNLTIFEVGMLFMLFMDGELPHDYAQFHTTQAGKKFILNIKDLDKVIR